MAEGMLGKVVIITGGSAGIGAAAVREFAARGTKVVLTGRSDATLRLAQEVGATGHLVDYPDLASVRLFADAILAQHPKIDVSANNVGGVSNKRLIIRKSFEMTFQVNHLSGFWLTELLRGQIEQSGGGSSTPLLPPI